MWSTVCVWKVNSLLMTYVTVSQHKFFFFLLFLLMFTNCSCPNCNPWIFCGEPTSWACSFVVKQSSKAKINVLLLSPVHVVLSQVQVKYKYICSYNYQTNGTCQKHFSTTDIRKRICHVFIYLKLLSGTKDCIVSWKLTISQGVHMWVWDPRGESPAGLTSHMGNGYSEPIAEARRRRGAACRCSRGCSSTGGGRLLEDIWAGCCQWGMRTPVGCCDVAGSTDLIAGKAFPFISHSTLSYPTCPRHDVTSVFLSRFHECSSYVSSISGN